MGRRDISAHELNQIIKLKEAGASWLKIQEKTGVPRRSTKLAYENWQKAQSMTDLKAARVNVAAELFKEHIDTLVNLARHIANHLVVPSSIGVSADQFLDTLLGKEILGQQNLYSPQTNDTRKSKSVLRYNQLLFKSLQDHTREEIRWGSLNEWRIAWDNFMSLGNKLTKYAYEAVDKENNLLIRIKQEGGNQDAVKCIADTISEAVCRDITDRDFDLDEPLVRKSSSTDLHTQVITTGSGEKVIFTFTDTDLADEVLRIFDSVTTELRMLVEMGNKYYAMIGEISKMEAAIDEIDDMLNPLILRPVILHSHCDLCPV